MKKTFRKLICATLAGIVSLSAIGLSSGCAAKDNIITDVKTVNVKIYSAGYGTEYIYALKDKFEATYSAEGYKVNVLPPMEDLTYDTVINEIYSADKTADVYFTTGATAQGFYANKLGNMVEDISDIYSQKPIKFDKSEEDKTIAEKLAETGIDFDAYNKAEDGNYYVFPYTIGYAGLVVNTKLLNELNLEIPLTTNEMFACYEKIMEVTVATSIRPITFSQQDNNYPLSAMKAWQAQYAGMEKYNKFLGMLDENGNDLPLERCYEVFKDESILKAMEVFYAMFDYNTTALGSANQGYTEAQAQIMNGNAAFMSNGTWLFNEEKTRHASKLNDIDFIRVPLISSLGIKLFGEGTKYGLDAEKCDKVLSKIASCSDENKSVEEIKALVDQAFSVNIDIADIKTVCERRGYTNDRSGTPAIISKKSQNKELAKLFLRFCASDDAGKLFAEKSNTASPYNLTALADSEYQWHRSIAGIMNNQYTKTFTGDATGFRKKLGVVIAYPWAGDILSSKLLESNYRFSIYDDNTKVKKGNYSDYLAPATIIYNNVYNHAKTSVENGSWKLG